MLFLPRRIILVMCEDFRDGVVRLNGSATRHGISRSVDCYTIGSSEAQFLGRSERSPRLLYSLDCLRFQERYTMVQSISLDHQHGLAFEFRGTLSQGSIFLESRRNAWFYGNRHT